MKLQNQKYIASILYHDIFDYPLSGEEIIRWKIGKRVVKAHLDSTPASPNRGESSARQVGKVAKVGKVEWRGRIFYFLKGRRKIIPERLRREMFADTKMEIAKRAAKVLSLIPTIKMVAVTGSLAMKNAEANSDIDLMIITKKGTLWFTRFISLVCLIGRIRRSGSEDQKDKLCMNMWFDESDLVWPENDRNIYTAHEIAQIIPLVNKDKIYEKFIYQNRWVLDYWPKAVDIGILGYKDIRRKDENVFSIISQYLSILISSFLEKLAFWLQDQYMKSKITREVVTPTRAIFHPNDFGEVVLKKLKRS